MKPDLLIRIRGGMILSALVCWTLIGAGAQTATDLRLVPFPKQIQLEPGAFSLNRRLVLEVSQASAAVLSEQIREELAAAGYGAPNVQPLKTAQYVLRLSVRPRRAIKKLPLREGASREDYALQVQPSGVVLTGAGPAGLFYGVQTLRQLIRANRQGDALPGVTIRDWPSLGWRAFQDDLTRGPSSTLSNLQAQVALGAFLKLNLFTYYMEHQFAFRKHPRIGPPDGSLTPEELGALVAFTRPLQMNILGNQQSFGHFDRILAQPEYAGMSETPSLLSPTHPRTYRLLDDFYSEVAPLLPFPYFNVCCDEVEGLGQGPSKPLADAMGPGALYVEHVRRLHDLLQTNYNKRMMMWGDIILQHPDQLHKIPKDTVMLTWGYDPRASFQEQIIPFVKAGYEFVVCPGVNGWNRILPQFGVSITNIQNFVRDGVTHRALGMINTAWDDDGETFNAPNCYGFAWGAECAWTGSTTTSVDFNRRVGAVLFGEASDAFGQAIQSLSTSAVDGLPNRQFWQFAFGPIKVRSPELAQAQWQSSLEPIRAAIAGFERCRKEAKRNADLLDYYLFGARRMELCFTRELDRLAAALTYRQARRLSLEASLPLLEQAQDVLSSSRDAHQALCVRFMELWARENKPYALDWTVKRYRELIHKFDGAIERLSRARGAAKPDRSLPTPREIGLELVEESRP